MGAEIFRLHFCNGPSWRRGRENASLLPALLYVLFHLLQRARPVLLQKARNRAIRKQAPFRLTRRAVIAFVFGINDALDRRLASRTGFPIPAMDRHLRAERRHLRREFLSGLRTQPGDPLG